MLRYTLSFRRSCSSALLQLRELNHSGLTLHTVEGEADLPRSPAPEEKGICTDQIFGAFRLALKIMQCSSGCSRARFFLRYVRREVDRDEK